MEEKQEINASEYKEKPIGFFKKIYFSITKFEKYPVMAVEGAAKAIKYLLQIMIIFSIIICISMVSQLYTMVQQGVSYLETSFPDLKYENGKLAVQSENPITIEDTNTVLGKIIIDTNTNDQNTINQYVQSIGQEESGIILLQDKAMVKNAALADAIEYSYNDLVKSFGNGAINSFTKQDIINFAKSTNMISFYMAFFLVMLIYLFVIYFMATLVDAFVLSVLGYITTLLAKLKIRFSAIFNMAVYALTLSVILNAIYIAVNILTGFEITYFQIMYTSVAYIYLAAAIFMIKSDLVKRQMELMKILEEQEVVKQEIKDREKQEEEKPKEQEKPEEKEKKDNKGKEEKKGEIPQDPEGSNA